MGSSPLVLPGSQGNLEPKDKTGVHHAGHTLRNKINFKKILLIFEGYDNHSRIRCYLEPYSYFPDFFYFIF